MTIWVAAQILSSSIEYLSAPVYNSSIIAGGSKDSDYKKGVDGLKLLLKFWRTASMLYDSICWMAFPNLLVKSRIDSSSCLRIVCKELMFLFYHMEQNTVIRMPPIVHGTSLISYAGACGTRLMQAPTS